VKQLQLFIMTIFLKAVWVPGWLIIVEYKVAWMGSLMLLFLAINGKSPASQHFFADCDYQRLTMIILANIHCLVFQNP
jgi:hypothetical protein